MEPRPDILERLIALVSVVVPSSGPALAVVASLMVALYWGLTTYLGVHDVFSTSEVTEAQTPEPAVEARIKALRLQYNGTKWEAIQTETSDSEEGDHVP